MNMLALFKAGDVVKGYCNGYFGRDDFDTKTCIYVRPKYALFENESGEGVILEIDDYITEELVAEWKKDEFDEEEIEDEEDFM